MKSSKKTKNNIKGAVCDDKSADCVKTHDKSKARKKDKHVAKGTGVSAAKNSGRIHISALDSTSFLALLFRSFISFSLIIIIGVSLIFVLSFYALRRAQYTISSTNIVNYSEKLAEGTYLEIPIVTIAGRGGWFEIVDADGKVVFSTLEKHNTYTTGEIECIQPLGNDAEYHLSIFKNASNMDNYLLTKSFLNEDGEEEEQYLLFGADYVIISGTIPTLKTQLTQKEFAFLTHNIDADSKLTKYAFESVDGDLYYAIVNDVRQNDATRAGYFFTVSLIVCIVLLFVIIILFYVRYIDKRVQKPLASLNDAMTRLATDDVKEKINYSGSKEFVQLYDSFNDMVELLKASEEQKVVLAQEKQRMLAGLSHDLKTPITIIQGFAKAIRDGVVSEEDKPKYLQIIISKSDMMVELINEFYEYTKLEHPDFALDTQKIDLAEFVRSFLVGIYDEFDLRGYNLETDIPEKPVLCMIDSKQFEHVLNNLTSNFFKYTRPGTTLFVGLEKREDSVVLRVADNGEGISQEARADIFKAFVVGEQSRNKQGSGLGLAVCQRIVSAHGGEIVLCDTPLENYTTQFEITLKIAQ